MNEEDINNLLYTLEIHHIDGTPVANLLQAYKEQEKVIDSMCWELREYFKKINKVKENKNGK